MFRFLHWRSLFRRESFEREMADEFAFHMEARTQDLVRSGLSPREAERQARIEFGRNQHFRAECRVSHGLHWLDELRRDAGYALRNLRNNLGFAALSIVSLAIGLAAYLAWHLYRRRAGPASSEFGWQWAPQDIRCCVCN